MAEKDRLISYEQLSEVENVEESINTEATREQLANKILHVLDLDINSDNKSEVEEFIKILNISEDIKLDINEKDNKTICTFSLNQSGIEKIEAIKYLRILEEI
ncbi:MAG: hypothetical protein Q9M94_01365, partial [Candidatus Gracilibacteria bacterium]|nr:hypothetical protein [Candidatus Gracilibacteria bacterium]